MVSYFGELEMDGTSSGLCWMVTFGISDAESSGSVTIVLVMNKQIKMKVNYYKQRFSWNMEKIMISNDWSENYVCLL